MRFASGEDLAPLRDVLPPSSAAFAAVVTSFRQVSSWAAWMPCCRRNAPSRSSGTDAASMTIWSFSSVVQSVGDLEADSGCDVRGLGFGMVERLRAFLSHAESVGWGTPTSTARAEAEIARGPVMRCTMRFLKPIA